jgi:tetratricopeptide (TPR) repeat protein
MGKHISRKELKRPDQFISFWTRFSSEAGRAMASRKKPVMIGLGVLAGVVTATLIVAEVRQRAAVRSSQMLARVEKIATADLTPADGAPAKQDGVANADSVPRFKTDKERLEAALKEVDHFLSAESHSSLRPEALLQKAGFLLDLQRPDEAIPIYTELLSGTLEKNLRFLGQEGLGYAYEAKGDLDQALAAFSHLGESLGPATPGSVVFYQDRALYHKARIAERKGNSADAVKLYHEVLDKAPTSPLREEISNRLAVLELK